MNRGESCQARPRAFHRSSLNASEIVVKLFTDDSRCRDPMLDFCYTIQPEQITMRG